MSELLLKNVWNANFSSPKGTGIIKCEVESNANSLNSEDIVLELSVNEDAHGKCCPQIFFRVLLKMWLCISSSAVDML